MRAALALLVLAACDGPRANHLGPQAPRPNEKITSAVWRHTSFEVDVDLFVATFTSSTSCATAATLVVDTVTKPGDRYELEGARCDELALTAAGDLVVLDQTTGHDWRADRLVIDTEAETIALGPASVASTVYRLVLSAPKCEDNEDCKCARLSRFEDDGETQLPLGRICD